jgi:flavodoxin
MNTLVIYDSLFGNTKVIAEAIAEGLGDIAYAVNIKNLTRNRLYKAELLVLGCPVHRKQPSENTLKFLQGLEKGSVRAWFTAFDTRYANLFAGSATGRVVTKLKHAGGKPFTEPKHFIVLEKSGPLVVNQINLARAWGMDMREHFQEQLSRLVKVTTI